MTEGISNRQLFAAMAMQGMLAAVTDQTIKHEMAHRTAEQTIQKMAEAAVLLADALILELDKPNPPKSGRG